MTVERAGEGVGGRRRRPVERGRVRWVVGDGGVGKGAGRGSAAAVEWGRVRRVGGGGRWSGGDGAHEIQSRNEGYNLNTIDLS